ncbi:hypothetical protein ABLG96_21330 [Nakamurella sp. A5-74]|uniref:Uncharacterized protein n=1 Tax=Nakamurella sp. A5-74 TaxID=3158264 RepID=A0AAU8DQR3_9ACTN
MQFQPTALILSASAQRELFDSVRLDTVRLDTARGDTARSDTARWDVARFAAVRRARPATSVTIRDHRVRRALARLLVRTAGAIEPRPNQQFATHG